MDSILQFPNSDVDLLLQRKDKLTVYSQEQFTDTYSVSVSGAVRSEGAYNFSKNMQVSDLINLYLLYTSPSPRDS